MKETGRTGLVDVRLHDLCRLYLNDFRTKIKIKINEDQVCILEVERTIGVQ